MRVTACRLCGQLHVDENGMQRRFCGCHHYLAAKCPWLHHNYIWIKRTDQGLRQVDWPTAAQVKVEEARPVEEPGKGRGEKPAEDPGDSKAEPKAEGPKVEVARPAEDPGQAQNPQGEVPKAAEAGKAQKEADESGAKSAEENKEERSEATPKEGVTSEGGEVQVTS